MSPRMIRADHLTTTVGESETNARHSYWRDRDAHESAAAGPEPSTASKRPRRSTPTPGTGTPSPQTPTKRPARQPSPPRPQRQAAETVAETVAGPNAPELPPGYLLLAPDEVGRLLHLLDPHPESPAPHPLFRTETF